MLKIDIEGYKRDSYSVNLDDIEFNICLYKPPN